MTVIRREASVFSTKLWSRVSLTLSASQSHIEGERKDAAKERGGQKRSKERRKKVKIKTEEEFERLYVHLNPAGGALFWQLRL